MVRFVVHETPGRSRSSSELEGVFAVHVTKESSSHNLGIKLLTPPSPPTEEFEGLESDVLMQLGTVVSGLAPDSPLRGLRVGDTILSVNGRPALGCVAASLDPTGTLSRP
jgi:S1-C subfamily serine protease